ncbi:MAG TPA: hypothetical protein VFW33_15775 [Gemmataceae bacterium]|nr:hypothetical protein [Gemmataceae bacterium]
MQVDPKDGRCRACGGPLTIIDAGGETMTVECECDALPLAVPFGEGGPP